MSFTSMISPVVKFGNKAGRMTVGKEGLRGSLAGKATGGELGVTSREGSDKVALSSPMVGICGAIFSGANCSIQSLLAVRLGCLMVAGMNCSIQALGTCPGRLLASFLRIGRSRGGPRRNLFDAILVELVMM